MTSGAGEIAQEIPAGGEHRKLAILLEARVVPGRLLSPRLLHLGSDPPRQTWIDLIPLTPQENTL